MSIGLSHSLSRYKLKFSPDKVCCPSDLISHQQSSAVAFTRSYEMCSITSSQSCICTLHSQQQGPVMADQGGTSWFGFKYCLVQIPLSASMPCNAYYRGLTGFAFTTSHHQCCTDDGKVLVRQRRCTSLWQGMLLPHGCCPATCRLAAVSLESHPCDNVSCISACHTLETQTLCATLC